MQTLLAWREHAPAGSIAEALQKRYHLTCSGWHALLVLQASVGFGQGLRQAEAGEQLAQLQKLAEAIDKVKHLDVSGIHIIICRHPEHQIDHLGNVCLCATEPTLVWSRCGPSLAIAHLLFGVLRFCYGCMSDDQKHALAMRIFLVLVSRRWASWSTAW